MSLVLTNPLGFWALLGIPAVIAIHFLQRQSREVRISTLFLLEQMQRESVEGSRWERLRSSIPLWLQLFMVLLLTWMLLQPRWIQANSQQPIAVVLDSSASMSAFSDEAKEQLLEELRDLSTVAATTELFVRESHLPPGNLYRGIEIAELESSLEDWEPNLGDHDHEVALRALRGPVGPDGLLIFVTDHQHKQLPFDARLLAVGSQKPNVGFAGVRVDGDAGTWTAIIRNYSEEPAQRDWFRVVGDQRTAPRTITLEPGEIRSLEGTFPDERNRFVLQLEDDSFPADNVLPIIRPQPRQLLLRAIVGPDMVDETGLIATALGNSRVLGNSEEEMKVPSDIVLATYDPLKPALPGSSAIVFLTHNLRQNTLVEGRITPENHPLIEHLNWEPLLVRRSLQIPRLETDQVLLWQGERPLILLRHGAENTQQLLFNFDLKASNALKLPAFIVLIHRFAEELRNQKPVLERRILETDQQLKIALPPTAEEAEDLKFRVTFDSWDRNNQTEVEVSLEELGQLRAPRKPGFLTVHHGEELILEASTYFADTREADLTSAASENQLDGLAAQIVEKHVEVDGAWNVWVLILMVLLLGSWGWIYWRQTRIASPAGAGN